MKNKQKRKGMWFAAILVLLLTMTACSGGSAEVSNGGQGGSHSFISSHHLPGSHPFQTEVLEVLFADLEEQTDGRISSDIYPAASLGAPGSQYDMAVTGEVDIAVSVHGHTPGRFPLVSVIELPFFATSAENGSEILYTLYDEFPEFQDEHGDTYPLTIFTAEPAQIFTAKDPIESPEDLRGKRVRSPSPLANQMLEELGASPVSIPMGDVFDALQKGVIDAAIAPYEVLHSFNLSEVVNYVTVVDLSATPFYFTMNQGTYDSLSNEDKELLNRFSGLELAKKSGQAFDVSGEVGVQKAQEEGIEFIELSDEAKGAWLSALAPITQAWIDDMEAAGYPAQQIYDRAAEIKNELN
ncbi:TRAP transporter substrate-binding protein [Bacillus sp. B15-48]|uniref:TRAP transporter substrate-binding protein n=1 Tax=Bacillus sp. B15-48 TaxID=1548601 RepID=UPI00193FB9DF|nr:TRAP transporter substrate-binding protein [Bacillus sp. B15-48]